ncbi:DoxX family protein [Methylophilus sp.]
MTPALGETKTLGETRTLGLPRTLGLALVFIWFFIGGIAHFVFTELEMKIVPPSLPEPRLLVLVSGALELIGALGILFSPTRRIAGWGLILLTIAVTPANIFMWQHPHLFPEVPYWALTLRLPLQLLLLACIWWSTKAPEGR